MQMLNKQLESDIIVFARFLFNLIFDSTVLKYKDLQSYRSNEAPVLLYDYTPLNYQ